MKSVADLLRDGDPGAGHHVLADDEVRRMRQVVLAHRAGDQDGSGLVWGGLAVLASIVLVALALGTWLADARAATAPGRVARVDRAPAPEPAVARQVQFVTPRGTRVVWVLEADTSAQEGIR
jgi:hypothetical protein